MNNVVSKFEVLNAALKLAKDIVANSPDAVQSTKIGLIAANEEKGFEEATQKHVHASETSRVFEGENVVVRGTPERGGDLY